MSSPSESSIEAKRAAAGADDDPRGDRRGCTPSVRRARLRPRDDARDRERGRRRRSARRALLRLEGRALPGRHGPARPRSPRRSRALADGPRATVGRRLAEVDRGDARGPALALDRPRPDPVRLLAPGRRGARPGDGDARPRQARRGRDRRRAREPRCPRRAHRWSGSRWRATSCGWSRSRRCRPPTSIDYIAPVFQHYLVGPLRSASVASSRDPVEVAVEDVAEERGSPQPRARTASSTSAASSRRPGRRRPPQSGRSSSMSDACALLGAALPRIGCER